MAGITIHEYQSQKSINQKKNILLILDLNLLSLTDTSVHMNGHEMAYRYNNSLNKHVCIIKTTCISLFSPRYRN